MNNFVIYHCLLLGAVSIFLREKGIGTTLLIAAHEYGLNNNCYKISLASVGMDGQAISFCKSLDAEVTGVEINCSR